MALTGSHSQQKPMLQSLELNCTLVNLCDLGFTLAQRDKPCLESLEMYICDQENRLKVILHVKYRSSSRCRHNNSVNDLQLFFFKTPLLVCLTTAPRRSLIAVYFVLLIQS